MEKKDFLLADFNNEKLDVQNTREIRGGQGGIRPGYETYGEGISDEACTSGDVGCCDSDNEREDRTEVM